MIISISKFRDVDDKINDCINYLTAVKNFKDELDPIEDRRLYKIKKIMEKSTLVLSRNKENDNQFN